MNGDPDHIGAPLLCFFKMRDAPVSVQFQVMGIPDVDPPEDHGFSQFIDKFIALHIDVLHGSDLLA